MPRVLGLDLATHTGWCVMEPGKKYHFGTWNCPPEPVGVYGRRYSSLFTWLGELRQTFQFDAVGYEASWMNPDRDSMHTLRLLTGFPIIVETWCGLYLQNRSCQVEARMAKKALTGDSFAKKKDMIAGAVALGWRVANDDEADAGAVAMCTLEHFYPSQRATT